MPSMPSWEHRLDPRYREIKADYQGPLSVGEIARRLPIARPAVSRHLRAL
jgi:DNA-binding transcriptional ArsR family regulator